MVGQFLVEVFFKKRYLITFDFGAPVFDSVALAIVIRYDSKKNENELRIYRGDSYVNKFMKDCGHEIGPVVDTVAITPKTFEEIEAICLRLVRKQTEHDCNRLFCLLRENFPKQVKSYGR